MALTYHGEDFMSESEPEDQDMLDVGLARNFDVKCLDRIGPGFRAEVDSSRGMCRGASKGSCGTAIRPILFLDPQFSSRAL